MALANWQEVGKSAFIVSDGVSPNKRGPELKPGLWRRDIFTTNGWEASLQTRE